MSSLKRVIKKLKGTDLPDSATQSRRKPIVKSDIGGSSDSIASRPKLNRAIDSTQNSPRASGIFHLSGRNSPSRRSPSPTQAVEEKLGLAADSDEYGWPLNRAGERVSKNRLKKWEKDTEKKFRRQMGEERENELALQRQAWEERRMMEELPTVRARYGNIHVNGTVMLANRHLVDISTLSAEDIGKEVVFRARVHRIRAHGAYLTFLVFRQQTTTVQGVLNDGIYFIHWARCLPIESVTFVFGTVEEPKAKEGKVMGTSIQQYEILINALYTEAKPSVRLPFTVHEVQMKHRDELEEEAYYRRPVISHRFRMRNRILDLRTGASQSVFRIKSLFCQLCRGFLHERGFLEIQTPKLDAGIFTLPNENRLAPPLAKKLCIFADFERVYEIGPSFRSETVKGGRVVTEHTSLDIEMTIDYHYHQVLQMIDDMLKLSFQKIREKSRHELEMIKTQFPHSDLVWLETTPRLSFAEAIALLRDLSWRDDNGEIIPEDQDFRSRDEIQLGRLIKEKYKTDYYILHELPSTHKTPFYAMPHEDEHKTNSFAFFLRGTKILTGGQRINEPERLTTKKRRNRVSKQELGGYLQGLEWAVPRYGGGSIHLEKLVMALLDLGHTDHAALFPPQYPNSMPTRTSPYLNDKPLAQPQPPRYPEASTTDPPWGTKHRVEVGMDFQSLEKLIARYGDASSSFALNVRAQIWRDSQNGAGVPFFVYEQFAIAIGNPLCDASQYSKEIEAWVKYITMDTSQKPIWLLAGPRVTNDLGANGHKWHTFSVAVEQRLNPSAYQPHSSVQENAQNARRAGIKMRSFPLGTRVSSSFRDEVDRHVREGQVASPHKYLRFWALRPWQDAEHRHYHYAVNNAGMTVAIVVLAQLSADHGWHFLYTLEFNGAPLGTLELLVMAALEHIAENYNATSATFGPVAIARPSFKGSNLRGYDIKIVEKEYHDVVVKERLRRYSEFGEKMGAKEDPLYVCMPPHVLALGAKKVSRAILSCLQEEE